VSPLEAKIKGNGVWRIMAEDFLVSKFGPRINLLVQRSRHWMVSKPQPPAERSEIDDQWSVFVLLPREATDVVCRSHQGYKPAADRYASA